MTGRACYEEEIDRGEDAILVEVEIEITTTSTGPSGYGRHFDPGSGAEFEIVEVSFLDEATRPDWQRMNAPAFEKALPEGADVLNRAIEWAEDNEGAFY